MAVGAHQDFLAQDAKVRLVRCQGQHDEVRIKTGHCCHRYHHCQALSSVPVEAVAGVGVVAWLALEAPDEVHDLVLALAGNLDDVAVDTSLKRARRLQQAVQASWRTKTCCRQRSQYLMAAQHDFNAAPVRILVQLGTTAVSNTTIQQHCRKQNRGDLWHALQTQPMLINAKKTHLALDEVD